MMARRKRERTSRLNQEPFSVTWAREKSGLTKRALAGIVGISEQLMGEIESGWRNATCTNLAKIADALNCPITVLERKRSDGTREDGCACVCRSARRAGAQCDA